MALLMELTTWITALNILLLLSILWVYSKNLAKVKAPFTMGLALFALLLLVENAVSLYFFVTMMPYFANEVESVVFGLKAIQAVAFAVLNWLTWK